MHLFPYRFSLLTIKYVYCTYLHYMIQSEQLQKNKKKHKKLPSSMTNEGLWSNEY